jgi:hypothetical protein
MIVEQYQASTAAACTASARGAKDFTDGKARRKDPANTAIGMDFFPQVTMII